MSKTIPMPPTSLRAISAARVFHDPRPLIPDPCVDWWELERRQMLASMRDSSASASGGQRGALWRAQLRAALDNPWISAALALAGLLAAVALGTLAGTAFGLLLRWVLP